MMAGDRDLLQQVSNPKSNVQGPSNMRFLPAFPGFGRRVVKDLAAEWRRVDARNRAVPSAGLTADDGTIIGPFPSYGS